MELYIKTTMKYNYQLPPDTIKEYVENILVIENYQITNPFTLPLYANGSPTLLFLNSKAKIKNDTTNYLTLFGQTVSPEMLTINEDFTLIAYFFKPYSLVSLFGIEAYELTNKPVDFNLLHRSASSRLQEQLLNAGSSEYMLMLINNYILKLPGMYKKDASIVRYAANKMIQNPDTTSLPALQKELHVTEKTFQRLFIKNIGIPPNMYRRINQFNKAFQQLNKRHFSKLTEIAYNNGYADQSHYIRAFKEFTNITPTDYLQARLS